MNFLEMLLSERLKEKNPMLEIFGSDRKVLQIACQDFTNYLKVHWELIGKESSECEIVERLEKIFNEDPAELSEFLSVWTGTWFKKWKERVKLLIGEENTKKWSRITRVLENAEPTWRKLTNKQEMQDMIISTLIRNGETCGTTILAENLLKMELGEEKKEYRNEREQVLNAVCAALTRAKELAHSRGPLIFVKVDKGYYQSTH